MIELKRFVERVVRPVRAAETHKLGLREELYVHLDEAYNQELISGCDPDEARRRAIARMGDSAELTRQMQATISQRKRYAATLNHYLCRRPGEPMTKAAWRVALITAAWMTLTGALTVLLKSAGFTTWNVDTVILARLMAAIAFGMSCGAYGIALLTQRFLMRAASAPHELPPWRSLSLLPGTAAIIFAAGSATNALAVWGVFDLWTTLPRLVIASAAGGVVVCCVASAALNENHKLAPWLALEIDC